MNRLDLHKEFAEVYAFVVDRARSFNPKDNDGPADDDIDEVGLLSRIDIGFGLGKGWVCVVFDTRSNPEPDGEWNQHIEGNDLDRPNWEKACDALELEPLSVVLPDGTVLDLPVGGAGLETALGDMLKGVLLKARADGVFAGMPRAARCELGVEEQDGSYGWPIYEERGQENLA